MDFSPTLHPSSPFSQALASLTLAVFLTVPTLQPSLEIAAVVAVAVHVVSFAIGGAPVTAILVPELNPAKVRGEGTNRDEVRSVWGG